MAERLIQSIERAADVLELFLAAHQDLSVKEISDKLGLSKSTVHGIIKTLEYRGYLEQNPDDLKYKLGLKLFELGNRVVNNLDLGKIARPIIKELVEDLMETVHLVVFERGEVIYIEKLDGPRALRIYSQVGKRAPIHCTGVGKAILAFQEEEEIERILSNTDLQSFTEYTLTDKEDIKKQLRTIQEQGYSIDDEEIELGLKCVAAPIFDHQGKVIAAISCASPKIRLSEEKLVEVIKVIKLAAAKISQSMGYNAEHALV
ncbi:IclR family transcriptional regulator [Neobacillus ginsengisoli]|uniref:DNA-binding IclR family transcriptional regulator n=1 Tax=Neobacillus ginsengisoli TaxID=904295 RepID=A0ABT9XXU3_9BACI|nr:IclR family transcriptional regulator [Neobacillus ginsengisoli]MDQ0200389.1 DNA-binding IclR family transcriptional regulator [Neobacillus ginsengisoli]